MDSQFDRLMRAMPEVGDGVPAVFARKVRELAGTDQRWRNLAQGVRDLDHDARHQARQLVADTFERITVYASGLRPDVPGDHIDAILAAKGGVRRLLRIDPKGGWIQGDQLDEAHASSSPNV